jgi:hypothetical protein
MKVLSPSGENAAEVAPGMVNAVAEVELELEALTIYTWLGV